MYRYELKDGCQLKLIQKVHKLNIFDREIEDVTYDIKIITDGFIDSNNDISEKYENCSKNTVRTTNLYLKNYTYAIVLNIGREAFYNGKVGGVINCIKNISIYLRNLNDKEALKTAKEVIKQIRQANSEHKDFSMNSLLREENNDFIFNVLDENVYFAKKLINEKTKKYRVSDLYLISAKGKERINYFLCTYNPFYNCYIEVLTNNIIEPDSNIEENYLPSILNELNIKISLHKKLNYYELIYLYDKIRNISASNLEDKHNVIDSGKKVMVKI